MKEPLLSQIHSPEDVKNHSLSSLNQLCHEIRQKIIRVLATNGGHLASNLGNVELTVALHKVFQSPADKLIWDVSHQSYTHKLLTGRNSNFHTLRQFKGVSGFSDPRESPHDPFYSGHAGTALSLALGAAKGRNLTKKTNHIIPIIGDGSLTCGLSLEALNNIPSDLKNFVVILNDNAMSISKNVGAISQILSRMINNPTTNRLYRELDALVLKIPSLGALLSKQGHKIAESVKNLVSPAVFFEHYNLSYIGPIDGHDLNRLIDTLERVKNSPWPVLIHVLTNKGQGMQEAMNNPVSYHGVPPFDPETGKVITSSSKRVSFPKIFGREILKMAEMDSNIVAITPAMAAGSQLEPFMKRFPERCLDVGIAESHAVTFGGGIAFEREIKVVIAIYSSFLQRAFDNLFHDVCLQRLPALFAIDRAGISGPDGATHHGIYDIAFLNAMPNLIICQPRNGTVLKELLESAFSWGQPAAIRYPNLPTTAPEEKALKIRNPGEGEILAQGEELLLIALGHMTETAEQVRMLLEEEGVSVTVVDPVFLKPLDSELFSQLFSTHSFVVTLEEHTIRTGMGSIINNFLLTQGFNQVQVLNLGIPDTFLSHGGYSDLIEELGLTPHQIAGQILHHFSLTKNHQIILTKDR